MRRIWAYGFMLTLTSCVSAGGGYDAGTYAYADAHKPPGRARGEAAEQADMRICDAGDPANIGSPAFNRCMRSHGWRFTHYRSAPTQPYQPDPATYDPNFGVGSLSPPPPPPEPPPSPPPPPPLPPPPQYDPITGSQIPGT